MIRPFAALLAALSLTFAHPALADGEHNHDDHPPELHVHDAYARGAASMGGSGAVFFMLHNNTGADDRLIAASADVAERIELHTHKEDANGVMQMIEIAGGIPLPAGEMHALDRGGDHVMLLGVTRELADGDTFPLTLTFESGSTLTVEVVVDNARKPGTGGMDHSGH